MFDDGIDRSHYRYRYFNLDRDVIEYLIDEYGFTHEQAIEAIEEYKPVFSLVDKYTKPWEIAFRIKHDKNHGLPPSQYIESLSIFHEASHAIAEMKKIPDTKNRPHEYCIRCNYPKYKDEECRFCEKSTL